MRFLSQRDPRWASTKIGQSQATVGRYGCTITSLSMATDYYGMFHDPKWMAQNLRFTSDGSLYWESVNEKLPPLKFVYRYRRRDDAIIKQALRDPKKVCIIEVQNYHWVLGLSPALFGGYNIADPWFGDKSTTRRYKDQITGFTIYIKP